MISSEIREEIVATCHKLDRKGWVANHDGNVSFRMNDGNFAATPTARAKADLASDDLIVVDASGKTISGEAKVFSEFAIHRAIFETRSDVRAVVHSHSPSATAVGCVNQEMQTTAVPEAVVSLGPGVPLVGLSLPGSSSQEQEVKALALHYDAIMIAGNGVFTWGPSLELAYLRMELVEHLATIFLRASSIGGPLMLQTADVQTLLEKRQKAGLALPPDPKRPQWFSNAN